MNNVFQLNNKTVLVTGASSGIGRACAVECSKAGANIIAVARNEERLEETMEQLSGPDGHQSAIVELTDYPEVDRFMESLKNDGKKVDGLINCAGISTTLPLRLLTPEKLQPYFETNVASAVYLTKWAVRNALAPDSGSSILFISSVMGSVGEAGKVIYSLTKGAVLAASRSLAIELASKNIRVNCISPGVVETPMSDSAVYSRDEEAREKISRLHPLGLGVPEDVAYAAVYLLSDASRWVTGSNLFVDGGYTAR